MDIVTHVMAPLYQLAWYYKLFCETIMWCTVLHNIAWHYLAGYKTYVFQVYQLAHIFLGAFPIDPSALYGHPCYAASACLVLKAIL